MPAVNVKPTDKADISKQRSGSRLRQPDREPFFFVLLVVSELAKRVE